MSRKTLLIFFFLLLVAGFLTLIIIPVFLQPGALGITDLVYRFLYFVLASLGVGVVYYLKTAGSERQLRAFWIVFAAGVFAFPFATIGFIIGRALLGSSGATLFIPIFLPLYLVGLAVGALIGHWVEKRREVKE